jgi:hypothetical protein
MEWLCSGCLEVRSDFSRFTANRSHQCYIYTLKQNDHKIVDRHQANATLVLPIELPVANPTESGTLAQPDGGP